jgi:hypothetical protein
MTPARLAEIRAYIARLDLDQLPGWTIEQRIIADLWEALPEVWDECHRQCQTAWGRLSANPYRDGERQ